MKPIVKVFATLALSATVGERIKQTSDDSLLRTASALLEVAGYNAASLYPYPSLTGKKIDQIGDAVQALTGQNNTPHEILSMVIAGLVEIRDQCNPDKEAILNPVIKVAQACFDLYPGEVDNDALFQQYGKWAGS